jgi:hypothetical protein
MAKRKTSITIKLSEKDGKALGKAFDLSVKTKEPEKPYVRSPLRDIMEAKAFTRAPGYRIDMPWSYLEAWIARHQEDSVPQRNLDLDPDFQRAHVWTREQQTAYVEYVMRGGQAACELYFNCVGWNRDWRGPFVIVDGKQRMEAVLRFLRGDVPAFGKTLPEWRAAGAAIGASDRDALTLSGPSFKIYINDLKTREEVLRWYLDLNTGGTPHTPAEIDKVRVMLDGQEPEAHQDVHTEHCCRIHGCKYGLLDGHCSVANGAKRPSFPCSCNEEYCP